MNKSTDQSNCTLNSGSALDPNNIALLKEIIKEAFLEHEADKESKVRSIDMSSASSSTVIQFMRSLNLNITAIRSRPESSRSFDPFVWTTNKDEDTPDACKHLHDQLLRFDVKLGEGNYKLIDVNARRDTLNSSDDKIGNITGGIDLAIVPYDLSENDGVASGFGVIIELKTTEFYRNKNNLREVSRSARMKLTAARLLSLQPNILVIITDLSTGALGYTISKSNESDFVIFEEYQLSLAQMAEFIAEFCRRNRKRGIDLLDIEKDDVANAITFKRKYTSVMSSLAWEQYLEEVEFTQPCSQERNQLITNHMISSGVEKLPVVLSPSFQSIF